ncbi:MAG TPA: Gfo/Idh/MocA family oxidoreductase [Thermoleophilia bacterium]|nr:Gfo/Idh/MocA family oxidoreductase [Thermoleophilia bacterium]
MSERVRIGLVGLGRWGQNLLRNFAATPDADLRWASDVDEQRLVELSPRYPAVRFTASVEELLNDPELEAIVVATPVPTHLEMALKVLAAGKDVMVEKPMTWRASEAHELRDAVAESGRLLMVGHLLRFHPAVEKLRELIDSGALGSVHYVYGNRVNLGVIRAEENVLWSLGVHDLSVVLHLLDGEPVEVAAHGGTYLQPGVEDVVFGYVRFSTGQIGHLHLSWLDPHKIRRMTVIGDRQMAVFDDMEPERKITVYDKGPMRTPAGRIATHTGDIVIPHVSLEEPLSIECRHFVHAVRAGATDRAGIDEGVAVVEVLEAMQTSLEHGGEPVQLAALR